MVVSLDKLISENLDSLVDSIAKDAILHIPSYSKAPLRQTIDRVELWLKILATSIQQNKPEILEQYLVAVANERQEEGYAIGDLHTIVQLTEIHLKTLIDDVTSEQVERNALHALLDAVVGAARMILSVNYVLITGRKSLEE
jgi:hypothetical protein